MLLGFGPFGTVERLMSNQIVYGSELDTTRGTDELDQRWRGRAGRRRTIVHRRLPRLAVMLLMSDKVLVSAEHDIAFLASVRTNNSIIPRIISQNLENREKFFKVNNLRMDNKNFIDPEKDS